MGRLSEYLNCNDWHRFQFANHNCGEHRLFCPFYCRRLLLLLLLCIFILILNGDVFVVLLNIHFDFHAQFDMSAERY